MKKCISLCILFVLLISSIVFAADTNPNFIIGKDEVKDYIVFGAGQAVSNLGTVNNDLFVVGQTVSSSGPISGDLFTAGQAVSISSPIGGSIRAACQYLDIKSEVGRNVLLVGQTVTLSKDSIVSGNVTAAGADIKVLGTINRGLNAYAGNIILDGTIVGDVYIESENINILPTAKIDGNLTYKSSKTANIPEGVVLGSVFPNIVSQIQFEKEPEQKPFGISNILSKVLWLIGSFVLGALLVKLFKTYFSKSSESIKASWPKYLGIGFLTLIIVPIAFIILLITIIGIPIALVSLVVYLILIYLAKIPVSIFIGQLILKGKSVYLQLLIGLVVLAIVYLIPIIGGFTTFVVILLGLGTLVFNLFFNQQCCEVKEPTE